MATLILRFHLFKEVWNSFAKEATSICESVNETYSYLYNLGIFNMTDNRIAHFSKKANIKDLGDRNMVSQYTIFRGGWELKNLHSFFDYWFGTFKSTIVSGKALMWWRKIKTSDTPEGGHFSLLCDICESKMLCIICPRLFIMM